MKIGDKVRFLSEVGGGIVKGFQGKDIVLVEDADGFDIPMQVRECVVIETDDYNINRKPAAAPKKAEEPAKPVKPEIPVLQRRPEMRGCSERFFSFRARRCQGYQQHCFRGLSGE